MSDVPKDTRDVLDRLVAAAALIERERCAKLAEDYEMMSHPRLSPGSEMNAWWSGQEAAAKKIAEAIRNQNA